MEKNKTLCCADSLFLQIIIKPLETPGYTSPECCCRQVASVVSDSVRPHRRQPTRRRRPWDSSGKNTGVGCHFLLHCMKLKSESAVAQSCPTLRDPIDGSLPGSSIHGIFQARVLEWVAICILIPKVIRLHTLNTYPAFYVSVIL